MNVFLKTALLVFFSVSVFAQSDMLLYNFDAIAQSLRVNPATPQKTRIWVGLPVVSGVQLHYDNNSFELEDIFATGTDVNANKDAWIMSLDDDSRVNLNQTLDVLGVGFRSFGGFVSLGVYQQADLNTSLPAEFLKLINFGNTIEENKNVSTTDFDFESMARTNYYVGFQKEVNDKLTLGANFKYIIGQTNTYTERVNATITTTDSSALYIETDILVRSAGLGSLEDYFNNRSTFSNAVFTGNNGFGIDLGAHYKISEKWDASASIVDLGFINWQENNKDYISNGTFLFDGADVDFSNDDPISSFDNVLDSLKEAFDFYEETGNSYKRNLSTKAFFAVNYHINKRHTFGALYHATFWDGYVQNDFGVNYQGRIADPFNIMVSYSVIGGIYNNIGLGIMGKLGPIQLYLMSDNAFHILYYNKLRATNIRFGINITLYDKKEKKVKKKKKEES